MADANVIVCQGLLSTSSQVVCAPNGNESTLSIRRLSFSNTHTGQVVISLNWRTANSSELSLISNMTLDPGDTFLYIEDGDSSVDLIQPEELRGESSVASVVSYIGFGIRTTP